MIDKLNFPEQQVLQDDPNIPEDNKFSALKANALFSKVDEIIEGKSYNENDFDYQLASAVSNFKIQLIRNGKLVHFNCDFRTIPVPAHSGHLCLS